MSSDLSPLSTSDAEGWSGPLPTLPSMFHGEIAVLAERGPVTNELPPPPPMRPANWIIRPRHREQSFLPATVTGDPLMSLGRGSSGKAGATRRAASAMFYGSRTQGVGSSGSPPPRAPGVNAGRASLGCTPPPRSDSYGEVVLVSTTGPANISASTRAASSSHARFGGVSQFRSDGGFLLIAHQRTMLATRARSFALSPRGRPVRAIGSARAGREWFLCDLARPLSGA